MAMNQVQFQRGLSMVEFLQRYGSEEECAAALFTARWPGGWRCPVWACPEHTTSKRDGRRYWQCGAHCHQSTLISGTVFEATKLPLTCWFVAMHLLPAGHLKVLYLWPGQTPPPRCGVGRVEL